MKWHLKWTRKGKHKTVQVVGGNDWGKVGKARPSTEVGNFYYLYCPMIAYLLDRLSSVAWTIYLPNFYYRYSLT